MGAIADTSEDLILSLSQHKDLILHEDLMVSLSNHEGREPPPLQRARGTARIATQLADGRTRLATLYQEGCARIALPNTHDPSLQAVLINTAGGLTGGDRINWHAEAAPATSLVLTTQACERVYRSTGADASVATRLAAGAGASLNWLPQETILFEHARLDRSLEVDLAEGASFCAVAITDVRLSGSTSKRLRAAFFGITRQCPSPRGMMSMNAKVASSS